MQWIESVGTKSIRIGSRKCISLGGHTESYYDIYVKCTVLSNYTRYAQYCGIYGITLI